MPTLCHTPSVNEYVEDLWYARYTQNFSNIDCTKSDVVSRERMIHLLPSPVIYYTCVKFTPGQYTVRGLKLWPYLDI